MSNFPVRLERIRDEISLPKQFAVVIGRDQEIPEGRYYYQVQCEREDVITGEWGLGSGGKAYLSEHATDSELVQTIFGLYKSYVEHEARETFNYKGRRVFGPHVDVNALWEVARRVDIRSAQHREDQK